MVVLGAIAALLVCPSQASVGAPPARAHTRGTTTIDPDGATLRADGVSWTIGLRALGAGTHDLRPVGAGSLTRSGGEVTISRPGVREWYIHRAGGLEQGFTVDRPLAAGDLTLALSRPRQGVLTVSPGGQAATVAGSDGESVSYSGLHVTDAGGRDLRASMRAAGGRLLVEVDTRDARYPIVVDPMIHAGLLASGFTTPLAQDGISVAISSDGTTAVVGTLDGVVNVYQRSGGAWDDMDPVATLTPSVSQVAFGMSVSVSQDGSVIAVGDPGTSCTAGSDCGTVYLYDRPAGGWSGTLTETDAITQQTSGAALAGAAFGYSVALSPDATQLAVGAPAPVVSGAKGAVWMFMPVGSDWEGEQGANPVAPSDSNVSGFGHSVAIIDDRDVVAGAPYSDGWTGRLLVLHRGTSGIPPHTMQDWNSQARLSPDASHNAANQLLGWSVAASAGVIVGGAPQQNHNDAGGVYVFGAPSGGWSSMTDGEELTTGIELTVPQGSGGEGGTLGDGVAVSSDGSTIFAGAAESDYNIANYGAYPYNPGNGGVFQFSEPDGGWASAVTPTATLPAELDDAQGGLGWSVAVDATGLTLVAGSPWALLGDGEPGAAEVFQPTSYATSACLPATVTVGQATSCIVTVASDGVSPTAVTPTGSVSASSDGSGSFGGGTPGCTLAATSTAGIASCTFTYVPSAVGSGTHTLTATYTGGDYLGASADATVTVTPAPPSGGTSGGGQGDSQTGAGQGGSQTGVQGGVATKPATLRFSLGAPSIHGNKLWLKLSCPGATSTCAGTIRLKLGKAALAHGRFKVKRRGKQTLKLALSRKPLRGRHGKLKITASIVGHDTAVKRKTATKRLTLKLPKRK